MHNSLFLQPIADANIVTEGLLGQRGEMNFARLLDSKFQFPHVRDLNSGWCPGDAAGRTLHGLSLLSRALHRDIPESLHEIVRHMSGLIDSRGIYWGSLTPAPEPHEALLAGHAWWLRGLLSYHRATGERAALELAHRFISQTLVPMRDAIGFYSTSQAGQGRYKWLREKGDIGAFFMMIDAATDAYADVPSPELASVIESMIAEFGNIDTIAAGFHIHTFLTALLGILRWYTIRGRASDLEMARKMFALYQAQAMTENYENFNWFGRPVSTEGCAVIDSYLAAMELWRLTGDPAYLESAHLILYNGMLVNQRINGGFGTSSCVGPKGNIFLRTALDKEAWWCCTMRGGEGLATAIRHGYFTDERRIVIPRYDNSTATFPFADGTCVVRQRTTYPHRGAATLEVIGGDAGIRRHLSLFVPSWSRRESVRVRVDGQPCTPAMSDGFIHLDLDLSPGRHIALEFDQPPRKTSLINAAAAPGYQRYFSGPLLLGLQEAFPVALGPDNDDGRADNACYLVRGGDHRLAPLLDLVMPPREGAAGDGVLHGGLTNSKFSQVCTQVLFRDPPTACDGG